MRIYIPNRRRMITGKEILGFLSLFRYDIIYIKVRHKWFGRQTSLLEFKIEETV